jgi:hypothetical protein
VPDSVKSVSDDARILIRRIGLVWTLESDRWNVGPGAGSTDVPEILSLHLDVIAVASQVTNRFLLKKIRLPTPVFKTTLL